MFGQFVLKSNVTNAVDIYKENLFEKNISIYILDSIIGSFSHVHVWMSSLISFICWN